MKKFTKSILTLLFCVFLIVFTSNLIFAQPDKIKIGWIGPLTGPSAEAGIGNKQGCILAQEEWNEKGGVYIEEYKKRIPIEIIFEDAQSKPEVGVSLGEKLITRDKVHLLFGDAFNSSVGMAVMELAPKYQFPIISMECVSSEISKKVKENPTRYWSFWKGNHSSKAYGKNLYSTYKDLIKKGLFTPKNKTLAFVISDDDYGRANAEDITKEFEKDGWKSLTVEAIPMGHTDFYAQLTKIDSLDPDILISCIAGSLASGVALIKQFHEIGLRANYLALFHPSRPEFIPQAGSAAEYILWTALQFDAKHLPHHKAFQEKVSKRWNVQANMDLGSGYDWINNACDIIERAGTLDSKKLVDSISKLDKQGIIGRYVFDQSNHEIKDGPEFIPLPTAQIINGENLIIWPFNIAFQDYTKQPWNK